MTTMTPCEMQFRLLLAVVVVTGVAVQSVGGYVEVVNEKGCHTTELRLTCRELDAQMAILDAFFTGNTSVANYNCTSATDGAVTKPPTANPPFLGVDDNETSITRNSSSLLRVSRESASLDDKQIILPVKHRCSGVNHCSFRLTSDFTPAKDWGPGMVFIKYVCINGQRGQKIGKTLEEVDRRPGAVRHKGEEKKKNLKQKAVVTARDEHITRNCQGDVSVTGEGFVETPGYPQFSVERNCTWRLRAPEGQRVQLTLLDISLRDKGSSETECIDKLTVKEDDRQLISLCGEKNEPIFIESDGRGLDVFVSIRSKNIFPKRGVLFQYKALGCPPLKTPRDGYLVDRNGSDAQYMCCVGFVFPDTSRRERSLHCENGNTWTADLPDCINVTNSIWSRNSSLIRLPDIETNLTAEVDAVIKESDFIYDIMLPTFIICVLLIGNGVIIFVIFYLRKRRKLAQQADDEELGAIFQPHDGNISDKAISV